MILGFAGAGNMAGAMARGWAAAQPRPQRMLFCDIDRARAEALAREVGGEARASLGEVRDESDALLLAVKPAALDDVAGELEGRAPALVSVMAATTTERLREAFPGVPALRVMPSQPVAVRRGVLCYVPPQEMPDELRERLVALLGGLGSAVPVPEEQLDAAMAVMSCSPAYVALFAEALARAGEREGLDPAVAARVVAETLAGTAALLEVSDPAAIRRAVAPPGGATEAGLRALEEHGLVRALDAAVEASLERFR